MGASFKAGAVEEGGTILPPPVMSTVSRCARHIHGSCGKPRRWRKTHANYAKSAIHTGDDDWADRTWRHNVEGVELEVPEIARNQKVARPVLYSSASLSRDLPLLLLLTSHGTTALLLGLGLCPATSSDKRRGEWAARCADAARDFSLFRELRRPRRGQKRRFVPWPAFLPSRRSCRAFFLTGDGPYSSFPLLSASSY